MAELTEEMKTLQLQEHIFKDVKFYVSGQVNNKTLELLKSGGAERMNYFSDYVTHLICGQNCEDTDLSDATEIYEIPALTEKWIFLSAQLKSLVNTKPYIYNINKLFTNFTFCLTRCSKDRANLWAVITYHGGKVQLNFNKAVTHLISTNVESEMTKKAAVFGVTVVSPDWIMESVKNKSLVDVTLFHPKLILYPKIIKRPDTTSITGFEPETMEAEVSTSTAESTQALLDKLKQRMPWNQPPPNVVAPSYAAQKTEQRMFSPANTPSLPFSSPSQVPRSVVHHTPQSTQQQFQSSGGPNFNRILEHLQTRPNMQGINRLNPQQMLQNIVRQKGPPNQIINQQTMVNRQIVGGNAQLLQQGQKMQLLQNQQRILIQNPQNIALHKQQLLQQNQQSMEHQQILQHQNQLISVGQIGQQAQNQQIIQGQQQINQQMMQQNQHLQQGQQILQQNQQGQQILQQNQSGHQNQAAQQILQQNQQGQQILQQNQQGQQILQQNQPGQQIQQILQQNPQAQQILQQNQSQQIQQQQINQQLIQGQQQQQNQQLIQGPQNQQIVQQQQTQLIQGQQQQSQLIQGQQQQSQLLQQTQQQIIQGPNIQQNQQQIIQQNLQGPQNQIIQQNITSQQNSQQIIQQNLQAQQNPPQIIQQNPQQIIQQNLQGQQNSQQIIQQNLQGQQSSQQIIQQNLQGQQSSQQIIQQNLQGQQNSQQIIQQGNQHQGQGQQNLIQGQQTQLLQQTRMQNLQQQQNLLKQQQILGQHIVVQNQGNQQQNQILNPGQIINQQGIIGQHIVNQNKQFSTLGPNKIVQFGQQGGQQIIVSSQNQFVSSSTNQNFQLNQQHFTQFNQQQPPQLVQTNQGQFVQQQQPQQQGSNLQIINHQQLINQQLQKQGGQPQHLLVNQQGNPQQFQQQPGQNPTRPPLWQQQLNIRHQGGVNIVQQQGTRVQWAGGNQPQQVVQRQFIQLDQETHQKLQQMAPEERALFVQKLQKRRQQLQTQQLQQRGGQIVIRTPLPAGLNPQQHMQWLQQQGIVLQQNIQQQQIAQPQQQQPQQPPQPPPTPNIQQQQQQQQQQQHAPGLSPIQQQQQQPPPPQQGFSEQQRQQQLRIQQQLQMQQPVQKSLQGPQVQVIRTQSAEPNNVPQVIDNNNPQNSLVNAKTKTALANMLNIRLQSGGSTVGSGPETITEHSAAGTLRLMTQQHNAALNSNNNRAQEILALQQKRAMTTPNSEIIRPPVPVPQSPQAEPPKLQYSPRSVLPIQHRPGTFYGHNPNLRLPPDSFLLGCIFVVVELERFLDESMPGWRKKIEKYGGEIEKQYCSRVTHVLCETQRHGVVMQALRDYKRCVTLYWLSDVMNRRQVLPPWTALHLPTMYLDTVPASKHLISLTGFSGTERDRVKHMIKYTGATLTTYFSKHNTLLIATKPEGSKYVHAKKWGVPVVNVQWLTDVMLGNFAALNQTEHIKYQQFTSPVNFYFDPSLVPNLMHAWKMPINITQESYESLKRNAPPGLTQQKPKKMKTENVTDENDNFENLPQSMTHRILFSRCSDIVDYRNQVIQLGGSLARCPAEATHLVLPQLVRTTKLLHCVCLGTKIVSESWLRDSHASKMFLPESNYGLDTKEFNSKYKCDFEQTMSTRNRFRLLDGKFFFITPSIFPNKKCLTEIIQACGGIVERTRRTLSQIEATNVNSPYSYIILTHEQDLHLVADLLKKKDKVRIVCNVELILSAVLKQTFEVDPYVVKVV